MPNLLFRRREYSADSKREAIGRLLANSIPDRDFYFLVIGAVAFALAAIFTDSIAVLIGAMIVAPLAYPILSLGLSLIVFDIRLMIRSFLMLLISLVFSLVFAFLGTLLFGHVRVDPVFISFGGNLWVATAVAIIAGAIAAYGLVRAKVGNAMTGIGIAVSLMPPLVATGVGVADGDFVFAMQTFSIYLVNVLGILIASSIVFATFGLRKEYKNMNAGIDV